ncbi:beta-1,4-glucuronyltransferase 1-like [Schistocerca cancellata]|uniref:beta-1,4-glucuronyltransferase 1-like n=1 Tax=Schistocerca cancellata TaxID=274614 RepID=UPI0021185BF1|nr:beta-1,4-glucuronyltransferase 1-like [Schistocerca cancellata]
MRCRRCRRYVLLTPLCIVAGLCFFLFLLPLLRTPDESKYQEAPALVLTSLSVMDASQKYRVRQFVSVGDRWQQLPTSAGDWTTCLALHASLSHVHHVERQARSWSGPLSVALFAAGDDVHLLLAYIMFLRRCRQHVRSRVSFHLLWPTEHPPNDTVVAAGDQLEEADCGEDDEQVLQRLLWRQAHPVGEQLSYPQNLARNTARLACPTKLTLCPDVDMLPGPRMDLAAGLTDLFRREPPCKKCAYILPVFELDARLAGPPKDKWELQQLVEDRLARPFHWEIFKDNQKSLDPTRWLQHANASSTQLSVAYNVKYGWAFEPVYVAASGELPLFDESFVGYGFTRNTQAYEMFASGWQFFVLDHAFLIHWGLQSIDKRPKWRWKENTINSDRFRKWVNRVALKYDVDEMKLTWRYADYDSAMTTCPRQKCKSARPKPTKSTPSPKKQEKPAKATPTPNNQEKPTKATPSPKKQEKPAKATPTPKKQGKKA